MIAEQPHILVVDDDARLRGLLHRYLSEAGFLVTTAKDAAVARDLLGSLVFDLVVLDVMMPGESGLSLARALHDSGGPPVLLLTALGETEDRIAGLESGADDYLPKPFEPRELVLRIQSVLRRSAQAAPAKGPVQIGPWQFVPGQEDLTGEVETVRLSSVEASLLSILARAPGRAFSREELVTGSRVTGGERTVDAQIVRLRRKLGDDPRNPRFLLTVRGEGYMLRTG